MVNKHQIFISSTFDDLKKERQLVKDAILKLGEYPAGMESFGARTVEQWKVIEEEILNADYYVVVIGKRYGSIVPNEGISYTQKEFRFALENGIPILGFIASDDADLREDTDLGLVARLKAFRSEVENGRTVDYWSNGDNLATKVVVALTKAMYGTSTTTESPKQDENSGITLRDGWNFHGDIAISLEYIARRIYKEHDRPFNKIYDADGIEFGYFAEVMIDLLREKSKSEANQEEIDQFIRDCAPYIGKSGHAIEKKTSQALFDRFKGLVGE